MRCVAQGKVSHDVCLHTTLYAKYLKNPTGTFRYIVCCTYIQNLLLYLCATDGMYLVS